MHGYPQLFDGLNRLLGIESRAHAAGDGAGFSLSVEAASGE